MRKVLKITVPFAILVQSLLLSDNIALAGVTHTLINAVSITTYNGMNCELAVAAAVDKSDVRIIRLDPRKGVYSVNYFGEKPHLFSKHGRRYPVSELVDLKQRKVVTMQSKMDFEDGKKEVTITVDFENGDREEARIRLDNDFFKDNASKCLK